MKLPSRILSALELPSVLDWLVLNHCFESIVLGIFECQFLLIEIWAFWSHCHTQIKCQGFLNHPCKVLKRLKKKNIYFLDEKYYNFDLKKTQQLLRLSHEKQYWIDDRNSQHHRYPDLSSKIKNLTTLMILEISQPRKDDHWNNCNKAQNLASCRNLTRNYGSFKDL